MGRAEQLAEADGDLDGTDTTTETDTSTTRTGDPRSDESDPDGIEELDDLDVDGLDDGDLDDGDDVGIDDDDDAGDPELEEDADLAVVAAPAVKARSKPAEPADGAADAETDDDELLADEVEASLDVILAERLRGDDTEADEQDLDDEEDEGLPNQLATVIPVRQPDEFLCQSCFLLKPPGQLADSAHQLCRDCA